MVRRVAKFEFWIWRIVAELFVLQHVPKHVDPEAIHVLVEPEPHYIIGSRPDVRVAPIEIRLFLKECMIVILLGSFVELPGASAKFGQPIVRRSTVLAWFSPEIPVS